MLIVRLEEREIKYRSLGQHKEEQLSVGSVIKTFLYDFVFNLLLLLLLLLLVVDLSA